MRKAVPRFIQRGTAFSCGSYGRTGGASPSPAYFGRVRRTRRGDLWSPADGSGTRPYDIMRLSSALFPVTLRTLRDGF